MRDSDILSRTPQTVVEIPVLLHSKTAIKKTPLFDFLQFRTIDSIQELQLFFYKYLYYNVIEIDLVKRDTLNKTVAYLKNTFDLTISKDNSVYKGNYDKDVLFNTFILDLYYIDDDLFRNICHEIFIFNVNGDFQIFSKQETKDYVRNLKKELGIEKARQLIKNQIYRKKYKSDDSDCNNLSSFLNFFLKNGKILFWSKKENFKRHETIYKNLEDKRPISIRIDIEAIIRYSVIAFNSNLYKKSSVWSEHLLLKMAGGVSVVNEDF
ncbi:MAG: hypothetical protein HYV28_11235, partial [Ignavibacteriales bacterium]|nr:hypothetical protein [Ignavibacteriales bacterium]